MPMLTSRRAFLQLGVSGLALSALPSWAAASQPRLLILIELRGGNDGLNTVLPQNDGLYRDLRPRLALNDDAIAVFAPDLRVHAALAGWQAMWQSGEMAVLESVGYPQPNLSHFRSIEIWDTASDSASYLQEGWLTRCVAADPRFRSFSADGVVIGAADLGPLAGGARAVVMSDPNRFARQARQMGGEQVSARGALAHLLRVEADILRVRTELQSELKSATAFRTEFPRGTFGVAVQHAAAIAATRRVPVLRLTLSGFDTHQNQLNAHAALLKQLADGVLALRSALTEVGLWDSTLVLTYSEFGRRARENSSGGTDHGAANVLFAFGPGVRGGRYGEPPALQRLDGTGNPPHALDFRAVYATVLEQWWGLDSSMALGSRFAPLPFLRT